MAASQAAKFDYLLKYIIIGDQAVGKSNILLRYTQGEFKNEYQTTIGVEFGAKNANINNTLYRIQIWDTAGQENFRSITRAYYKNSACALIVYDITKRESFENVQTWIEDCKNQSSKTLLMILVGNKNDLENERQISFEEGFDFAKSKNMLFYETSAKTGNNISILFEKSAQIIAKKIDENYYDLENDSCGIKQGYINNQTNFNDSSNISLDLGNKTNNNNNGCC